MNNGFYIWIIDDDIISTFLTEKCFLTHTQDFNFKIINSEDELDESVQQVCEGNEATPHLILLDDGLFKWDMERLAKCKKMFEEQKINSPVVLTTTLSNQKIKGFANQGNIPLIEKPLTVDKANDILGMLENPVI